MKYTEGRPGRVFVVRLEDGEIVHEEIEALALKENIRSAGVIILGGADKDSKLVCGPEDGRAKKIETIHTVLDNVHEVMGTGSIFPGPDGSPILHMHITAGRRENAVTGCIRSGVRVWQVMEVLIMEITGVASSRQRDKETGFDLLEP
ncbi:MAG: DNA-binding protein [Elusimicrobia bacterium]|nr:DNA-binding protein [Elusimicrobiota bacterium]